MNENFSIQIPFIIGVTFSLSGFNEWILAMSHALRRLSLNPKSTETTEDYQNPADSFH
jgi:hypothetical protein